MVTHSVGGLMVEWREKGVGGFRVIKDIFMLSGAEAEMLSTPPSSSSKSYKV